MKRTLIISVVVCIILLLTLTGCRTEESKTINDKLDLELNYVEDLIFKIANKHAKGEYLKDDKINWEDIKSDILKINDSWSTLVLDLTEVNVSNENIISFSNDLNYLMISVSDEDEITMLDKINKMYSELIIYKQSYSDYNNEIEKKKIKNGMLSVYVLVNKNDYEGAKKEIANLIEKYKFLMNDTNYAEENKYHLNKIYVLLEEYNNAIQTQNFDLIRMKYISAVEEI